MVKQIPKWKRLSKIRFEPPSPAPDRHGIAIAAIMRDEEDYVEEWAAFHRYVGVRHFYIYDNGSRDKTNERLRAVLGDNVTIIPWQLKSFDARFGFAIEQQTMAYVHAILNFGADFRWMSFIDVDEFILPKSAETLPEVLARLEGVVNISLPWHNFGTSGHKVKPEGGVLENYTERTTEKIFQGGKFSFKCIVDPSETTLVRTHYYETKSKGGESANDKGVYFPFEKRNTDAFYSNENLQLNHYYTRSEEEFFAKLGKGRVSTISPILFKDNAQKRRADMERDTVHDDYALRFVGKF